MMVKTVVAWVRWFDASYQRGECSRQELVRRVELESAGLLVEEDDEGISIALDRYEADGVFRYIENIPRQNIISIRKLTVPGAKTRTG